MAMPNRPMRMTLKRAWRFTHGYDDRLPDDVSESGITLVSWEGETLREYIYVPAGIYDIELIDCPVGYDCKWLVIKGTLVGMAERAMREWGPEYGDWEIRITTLAKGETVYGKEQRSGQTEERPKEKEKEGYQDSAL